MERKRARPTKLRDHAKLWIEVHQESANAAENEWVTSSKSISWVCSDGHVWRAKIRSRYYNNSGCPYCAGQKTDPKRSLAVTHPNLARQLDTVASGISAEELMPSSKRIVWWICEKSPDHRWQQFVGSRTRRKNPSGCPFCRGYYASKGRNLEDLFPNIAEELDCERTQLRAVDIPPKSGKKLPWRCRINPSHRWTAVVASRTSSGHGCPFCNIRMGGIQEVQLQDSVSIKHPELVMQWHPDNSKHPSELTPGSGFLALWQCPVDLDHVWKARVYSRTRGQSSKSGGCPICASKVITSQNSLRALNPDIANQWHSNLNGTLTPDHVVPGARRKAWWKCGLDETHVWQAAIFKRTSGGDCPFCIPARTSRQQIRLALECRAVLGIDPDDHKIKPAEGRVLDCDIIDRQRNVIIEFDGAHWHSDPLAEARDNKKTQILESLGWNVIRVRELPLRCTRTLDISVPKNQGSRKTLLQILKIIDELITPLKIRSDYEESNRLWSRGEFDPYYRELMQKQAEKNIKQRLRKSHH